MGKMTDDGYIPSAKEMRFGWYDGPNPELYELSQLTKRELIEKVLGYEKATLHVLMQFDWVFAAFVHTLATDMRFGKKRIRQVLDGVRKRFARYSAFDDLISREIDDDHGMHFDNFLEDVYGYRYYFHGGKVLLRDLKEPKEQYFEDLGTDLRKLARKIEAGRLDLLTDKERESLEILREANPPAWEKIEKEQGNGH